jgi:hypothetical protein
VAVAISTWHDLRAAEKQVLEAIGAARFGAQRFLADPVRFLREAGFTVAPAFAKELHELPGVRANPRHAYDEITAGRHPICRRTIRISGLGLPPGLDAVR